MESYGDILQDAMFYLIAKEAFYAELVMSMVVHIRTDIPTAGVNITDNVNLYINPYFWKSLSTEGQVNVLKHECLHILNNHFSRFRELCPDMFEKKKRTFGDIVKSQVNANVLNMAADYAINEWLKLPKTWKMFDKDGNCVTEPEKIPQEDGTLIDNPNAGKDAEARPLLVSDLKKQYPKVEKEQTMEYYYSWIQEQMKNQQVPGNGDGKGSLVDDHGLWGEGAEDEEYVKEKIRQTVNKAAEKAMDRNAGSIPMEIQQLIDALNYKPRNWKGDLQRFVARTSEIKMENTRKKRNRRYGIVHPGIKTYPKLHLFVGFDASGSVGDEECGQFFAEIGRIHELGVEITICEFDAKVNAVYKFDPRKKPELHGRGGTMFGPAFEEAKNHDIDGMIMLTDGGNFEGPDDIKKPKFPVLWALLPGCSCQYNWGRRTEVKVNKKK